jgi:hypothetical protein
VSCADYSQSPFNQGFAPRWMRVWRMLESFSETRFLRKPQQ